ncbi:hypothetical protein ACH5RR_017823 [Cinchona calisaya]|uniref:S-locus receptor kinase C-terminal domain-containing protein n=1 Tax=Cinchona calisaya TaxID=153742 RepID=A0ABD2ZJP3_9GENT
MRMGKKKLKSGEKTNRLNSQVYVMTRVVDDVDSEAAGKKPQPDSRGMEDLELPSFEMISITKATNNFSDLNKIGEGGFGSVNKRHPEDRPSMSTGLSMLDGLSTMLPQPKQPGFYSERSGNETEDSLDKEKPITNDLSITLLEVDRRQNASLKDPDYELIALAS